MKYDHQCQPHPQNMTSRMIYAHNNRDMVYNVHVGMVFTWAGGCHLSHPHHLCLLQMLAPSVVVCGVCVGDCSNTYREVCGGSYSHILALISSLICTLDHSHPATQQTVIITYNLSIIMNSRPRDCRTLCTTLGEVFAPVPLLLE